MTSRSPTMTAEERELYILERRWTTMKATLGIAIAVFVTANAVWTYQAIDLDIGLPWQDATGTTEDGSNPATGVPAAHYYDQGFWSDAWKLAAFVGFNVVVIGFWFWLMNRVGDSETSDDV